MRADIKKLWVDALRSGEYEQGDGKLRMAYGDEPPRHCCLGVLCDIAAKEGIGSWETNPESLNYEFLSCTSWLPLEVADWAGIRLGIVKNDAVPADSRTKAPFAMDPSIRGNSPIEDTSLSILNDDDNLSFKEIADIIEAKL